MKERVTLTIEQDLLKQVDSLIDNNEVKNRSHAIEMMLYKALGGTVPKKCVILAGGAGIKLEPLTYETSKALVPVLGRTITEHIFDLLKRYGITDIVIAAGKNSQKIKEYYGNGEKFGVKISYFEEDKPLGTAGALRLMKSQLKESFIVTNCDQLININIAQMYKVHQESKALATIALTVADRKNQVGVTKLEGFKVVDYVEEPFGKDTLGLVSTGFYIMEPEVLELIPEGKSMLELNLFPKLAKRGQLAGYPFSGQWFHADEPNDYYQALKQWEEIR